jgi:beta-N-acetylhexosaminidase
MIFAGPLSKENQEGVLLSVLDKDDPPLAVIFGLSGTKLTKEEKKLFKEANPLGFILFSRNCESPKQLKSLTKSLNECLGRNVPILIDEEGGRVSRLNEPGWTDEHPPAKSFGDAFMRNFAKGMKSSSDNTNSIAKNLKNAGINVNCAPVMDVLYPDTSEAIGDRAFSSAPDMCGTLGAHVCRTYLQNEIIPVMKHLPGQGRAKSDSHKQLPVVDASLEDLEKTDFKPFMNVLAKTFSEAVFGMVAHVVYKSIDDRAPASCSRPVIYDVIRTRIGFKGLLLSDDIDMGALEEYGDALSRARSVLRAGCDIALHCNGKLDEMQAIADKAPKMTPKAVERYNNAIDWLENNSP